MDSRPSDVSNNDEARLQELYDLQILDTPEEDHFDKYTELLADVLDMPFASIALVTKNRLWLKSEVGFDSREIDPHQAFSAEAISHEYLEVPDTHRDNRFTENPCVTKPPFLRFYAGAVLHGPTGKPVGTLAIMDRVPRELSARHKSQLVAFARLVEQELLLHERIKTRVYDPATGLPARELMATNLTRCLEHDRVSEQSTAVLHVKLINYDTLTALVGHDQINRVVHTVIQRLKERVEPSTPVGRLSINHIGVIFGGLQDTDETHQWLEALATHVATPIEVGVDNRIVRLAAGIAWSPKDATIASDLLDCAQIAAAEANSTNEHCSFYSDRMRTRVARRHDMANRLRDALDSNELEQLYQPIVASTDSHVVAVEALARWHDPVYGQVSPAEFVPLCEEDPTLRRALANHSLDAACAQISHWMKTHENCPQISVNMPGAELYRDDFASTVRETLKRHDVPADRLLLEVTEQSLITDIDAAVTAMNALRQDGIQFAADDFGTGYSSLSYLQKLPLDGLKVDRSFICQIATDHVTRELTRNIIAIAHTLDLRVIAEGVETFEQQQIIQALEGQYQQGFWFGHPQSAENIEAHFLNSACMQHDLS